MNNHDPPWISFKEKILDHFEDDSYDPVNDFKRIHQTTRVDEYAKRYERIKARALAKCYSTKKFYLLWFLSGLKEEIADAVILYEPTTLKQEIKIAKKVEKSLDNQTRVLKTIAKATIFQSSKFNKVKEPDKPLSTPSPTSITDPSNSKNLTIDQKISLGLYFKCGAKYHQGHKCKIQGLHVMNSDELSEIDSDTDELATYSSPPCKPKSYMASITFCVSQSMTHHRTIKLQG
jgi:Ty3 transposon capsid-like protein